MLKFYQVDAFTSRLFGGNPAGVVLLEKPLADEVLQAVATENNLSETAFLLRRDGSSELRWFTPRVEVDLCGHATLATAHVLFEEEGVAEETVHFESRSGRLSVSRDGDLRTLDFPARPPHPVPCPDELVEALGVAPREVLAARDLLVVLASEEEVAALTPRMDLLARIDAFAVNVTAPGRTVDFVSRFFAPRVGIDEDPVTGSAHCTLAPFWAERLGKRVLQARQVSRRGGELVCEHRGDRVLISGRAVVYLRGHIAVP